MARVDNLTVFFVKPTHFEIRDRIFEFLEERIGDYSIVHRSQPRTVGYFWEELYKHVEEKNPDGLQKMVHIYPNIQKGSIDLAIFFGEGITSRISSVVGPTVYGDNPNTIRGRFGPYSMPDTIVHASKPEEVENDLKILKKYRYIDDSSF